MVLAIDGEVVSFDIDDSVPPQPDDGLMMNAKPIEQFGHLYQCTAQPGISK
jgi:hypothetical protein